MVRKALFIALVLVAVVFLAVGLVYLGSVWRLKQLPVVPAGVAVPELGEAAEGKRLAAIVGCTGCHGEDLGGRAACYEIPGMVTFNCPNVTAARERYDDLALVTLLRHGRKLDGALVDFMPWDMYAHLSDRDLGHILAYVRSVPAVRNEPLPPTRYSWATRWDVVLGEYPWVNDLADYDTTPLEGIAERGRYLASIACPECHAPDLHGYEGDSAPNLVVVKAYSDAAFARLMHEGITLSGQESASGLMTAMARSRFVHFRPDEIAALKAYLDQH
jgi:mono/diheme cytochrome c family protein